MKKRLESLVQSLLGPEWVPEFIDDVKKFIRSMVKDFATPDRALVGYYYLGENSLAADLAQGTMDNYLYHLRKAMRATLTDADRRVLKGKCINLLEYAWPKMVSTQLFKDVVFRNYSAKDQAFYRLVRAGKEKGMPDYQEGAWTGHEAGRWAKYLVQRRRNARSRGKKGS